MTGKTWLGLGLTLAGAAVIYHHDGYWVEQLLPEQRLPAEPLLRSYWSGPALVGLGFFTVLWPRKR